VITCHIRYELDADRIPAFEQYAEMWLELLPRFGGTHHGYFLPSEGASDIALATFSFPSFAAYEQYRKDASIDPDVARVFSALRSLLLPAAPAEERLRRPRRFKPAAIRAELPDPPGALGTASIRVQPEEKRHEEPIPLA
jgi:hypothetical protein